MRLPTAIHKAVKPEKQCAYIFIKLRHMQSFLAVDGEPVFAHTIKTQTEIHHDIAVGADLGYQNRNITLLAGPLVQAFRAGLHGRRRCGRRYRRT